MHLDRSEGWARVVRGVFGRTPLAFPNLFLPTWQIEGLATYEESAITGDGRLHAGDFRAIDRRGRARSDALEPLDRVNGGLTDWPGGPGAVRLRPRLSRVSGRSIRRRDAGARWPRRRPGALPYHGLAACSERVYGQSLGALWRDYAGRRDGAPRRPQLLDGHRATRD